MRASSIRLVVECLCRSNCILELVVEVVEGEPGARARGSEENLVERRYGSEPGEGGPEI